MKIKRIIGLVFLIIVSLFTVVQAEDNKLEFLTYEIKDNYDIEIKNTYSMPLSADITIYIKGSDSNIISQIDLHKYLPSNGNIVTIVNSEYITTSEINSSYDTVELLFNNIEIDNSWQRALGITLSFSILLIFFIIWIGAFIY